MEARRESMPRKMIFVESNTTGSGMRALTAARRLGMMPVLFTNRPDRYHNLAQTRAEVIECNTNHQPALRAAIDRLPRREIAGLTTTSEFYLAAVADLAHSLGMPGNPVDAVTACRNKALTRSRLAAAGLAQPRFVVVREIDSVPAAVERVGLPCIVKLADDTASYGVCRCQSLDEAMRQAGRLLSITENVRGQPTAGAVLVEEYMSGTEFSVEMFFEDGSLTCVGITETNLTAPPHCVELGHVFPAALAPCSKRMIVDTVRKGLTALGLCHGPSHTEVKLVDGKVVIIEVNARLAGGMIPELIRLVDGIDLLEQQIRAAVGHPVSLRDQRTQRAGYAGIRFLTTDHSGTFEHVHGLDTVRRLPGVVEAAVTTAPGTAVQLPRSAYDRLGHIIVRGNGQREVVELLTRAERAVDIVVADFAMGRQRRGA
jgi:S-sulfo-L-cysteine synthase (3-phospho-L-serine-dependent)